MKNASYVGAKFTDDDTVQFTVNVKDGNTVIDVNLDGDKQSDWQLILDDYVGFSAKDLTLVKVVEAASHYIL